MQIHTHQWLALYHYHWCAEISARFQICKDFFWVPFPATTVPQPGPWRSRVRKRGRTVDPKGRCPAASVPPEPWPSIETHPQWRQWVVMSDEHATNSYLKKKTLGIRHWGDGMKQNTMTRVILRESVWHQNTCAQWPTEARSLGNGERWINSFSWGWNSHLKCEWRENLACASRDL